MAHSPSQILSSKPIQKPRIDDTHLSPRNEDSTLAFTDFQYQPLLDPSTDIRLLILLPNCDHLAPIECKMSMVLSADSTPFEALSYHWGPPVQEQPITVNGKRLLITKSLKSALRGLRKANEERRLWADGVCIDQSMQGLGERGAQVTQMTRIFARAERVVAWLADGDQGFYEAFAYIYNMARSPLGPSVIFDSFLNYEAFTRLISLPWWKRVWVFQEVVAAKEVFLICGNISLSLNIFLDAGRNLTDIWSERLKTCFENITLHPRARRFLQTREYRVQWSSWVADLGSKGRFRKRLQQSQPISLMEILSSQRGPFHGASDPRDRVNALSGLSVEHQDLGRVYHTDYSQSIVDTYIQLARSHIQVSGKIDILSLCRTDLRDDDSKLPSWVPDWQLGDGKDDLHRLDGCQLFDAGGGTNPQILETSEIATLKVMGIKFDKVDWVLVPDTASNEFRALMLFLYGDFFPIEDLRSRPTYFIRDPEYRVLRDLHCDRFDSGGNCWANLELPIDPLEFMRIMAHDTWVESDVPRRLDDASLHLLCAHVACLSGLTWTRSLFLSASTHEDHERLADNLEILSTEDRENIAKMFEAIRDRLSHEMMIRMSEAGYAMVPWWSKEGDIIVILLGSSVPYVLREQDDHYILIGEAYVPGIMDGEVFEEWEYDQVLEIFDIR